MKKILLLIFSLCIFPNLVFAKSNYFDISDDLILEENKNNSYIVFGDNIQVKNTVDGIYTIFGSEINYNTNNDYVMIFADEIDISGSIKDGIIFGNDIELSNVNISRDIIIFGNEVKLNGNFNGNILVVASLLDVKNSTFSKDLITYSNKLNIDSKTIIEGKLQYNDDTFIKINSKNIGNIVVKDNINSMTIGKQITNHIYKLIGLLVIFLVMHLIIPYFFDKLFNKLGKNFLYGTISFLGLPLILVILLFTNFATKVALIGILLYVIFIMISKIIVGYIIGDILWNKFIKSPKQKYLCGILGITTLYIISIIPIFGDLVTFVSLIYSFGIITNSIINKRKK